MAETAAYLVDCVIPRVPVRQWVLSFPIPLRILFGAHPELLPLGTMSGSDSRRETEISTEHRAIDCH